MRRLRHSLLALLVLVSLLASLGPRPVAAAGRDYAIDSGHFFTQATSTDDRGYAVIDDGQARFWSEFQRLGGLESVGYPISQRFTWHGYTVQAFQKLVLQWRPEYGQAWAVNLLDLLHEAGQDPYLEVVRQTPPPQSWDEAGRPWEEVVARRQAVLTPYPALAARYWSAPGDPQVLYGLPTSDVVDMGNNYAVRAQRAILQQWKVATPWAAAGEVTVANGGDLAKETGLLPADALAPVAAPPPAAVQPTRPIANRPVLGRPASGRELAQIETIEQRLTQVRGLPFLEEVDKRLLTRNEIQTWFARAVDEDDVEALRAAHLLWVLLGLLPESLDLAESYRDLYGSQIIGLYLPAERRLYVLDEGTGNVGPATEVTVAHELAHALQDQHFDLGRFLYLPNTATSDEALARRAVTEGDAVFAHTLYAQRFVNRSQVNPAGGDAAHPTTAARAPLILRELLFFPYSAGSLWAQALYNRADWDPINGAFQRPPQSTAEILHPNRYLAGIRPNRPELPDISPAIGPDWGELDRDSLGELIWRTALRQYLGFEAAAAAANGLAGDSIVLLENVDRQGIVAARLEFDNAAEAAEFFAAYSRVNQARFGAGALVESVPGRTVYGAYPAALTEQRGSAVIVAIGPTVGQVYAADAALP